MDKITVYSKENCTKCEEFKLTLVKNKIDYNEITDTLVLTQLAIENGIRTAPIVLIENNFMNSNDATEYIENKIGGIV